MVQTNSLLLENNGAALSKPVNPVTSQSPSDQKGSIKKVAAMQLSGSQQRPDPKILVIKSSVIDKPLVKAVKEHDFDQLKSILTVRKLFKNEEIDDAMRRMLYDQADRLKEEPLIDIHTFKKVMKIAIENGDVEILKLLIKECHQRDQHADAIFSILKQVVAKGQTEVAKCLLNEYPKFSDHKILTRRRREPEPRHPLASLLAVAFEKNNGDLIEHLTGKLLVTDGEKTSILVDHDDIEKLAHIAAAKGNIPFLEKWLPMVKQPLPLLLKEVTRHLQNDETAKRRQRDVYKFVKDNFPNLGSYEPFNLEMARIGIFKNESKPKPAEAFPVLNDEPSRLEMDRISESQPSLTLLEFFRLLNEVLNEEPL